MEKIDVAIADDCDVTRRLIIHALKGDNSNRINIVIEAENGTDLLTKLQLTSPDIILMDIEMPEINGIEAMKMIMDRYPHMKVIALTNHDNDKYVSEMYAYKVKGFLAKRNMSELPRIIESVYEGKYTITDKVRLVISQQLKKVLKMEKEIQLTPRHFAADNQKNMTLRKDLERLTPMELKVLSHTACHKTIKEIASNLGLSSDTVNSHQYKIRKKLNLSGRNSLAQYAQLVKEDVKDMVQKPDS